LRLIWIIIAYKRDNKKSKQMKSIKDKAIGYVMGSLSIEERDAVGRERLYHGALDEEIRSAEQLFAGLHQDEADGTDHADLWGRISDALEQEKRDLAGKYVEECSAGEWQEHGPRIEFKPLWSDKAILIRCNPGAIEEAHDQPEDDDEHILVIAGDLDVGGRVFGTGDYIRVPAGTQHRRMSTRGGCILFTEYRAP
jgi:hypothetical protein